MDICGACHRMNQRITGDQEQQGHSNANQSRTQADDEGFRVEHLGYIPLGRANGAKDADVQAAFVTE